MVLLAAAICNKNGKVLVSRQFVEMARSRVEGVLNSFGKLLGSNSPGSSGAGASAASKQHTFIETDSYRYVYQPIEKLYVVLVTTRASNILEDLETLRLFARVIPEYCRSVEEADILENAFQLIFAFDEMVALGYRESVTLPQVRTFTEMDSHDERVAMTIRETQIREQKREMQKRARDLALKAKEAEKYGIRPGSSGFGSSAIQSAPGSSNTSGGGGSSRELPVADSLTSDRRTGGDGGKAPPMHAGTSRALKLGKPKDVDSFVEQLKEEGEKVSPVKPVGGGGTKASNEKPGAPGKPSAPAAPVQVRIEEKLSAQLGRDGDLRNLELLGMLVLRVKEDNAAFARIKVDKQNLESDRPGVQLQTHPNIDKKVWTSESALQSKAADKPFPSGQDLGILKWRFQTNNLDYLPLSINCWPNPNNSNGFDVNIEYELKATELELSDLTITIPIPAGPGTSGTGGPVVSSCDGDYRFDAKRSQLVWSLPLVDVNTQRTGALEFSIAQASSGASTDNFFPISVQFKSPKTYCPVAVMNVEHLQTGAPLKFGYETQLVSDKFEIV